MDIRAFSAVTRNLVYFLIILSLLFFPYSIPFAQQVVISPERVNAPTFRTSDAVCYGSYANTHINLGFGTGGWYSVTGTNGKDYRWCTVGGGYSNKAYGDHSTVSGGSHISGFQQWIRTLISSNMTS